MKALHVIPTLLISAAAHCAIILGMDSQFDEAALLDNSSAEGTTSIQVIMIDTTAKSTAENLHQPNTVKPSTHTSTHPIPATAVAGSATIITSTSTPNLLAENAHPIRSPQRVALHPLTSEQSPPTSSRSAHPLPTSSPSISSPSLAKLTQAPPPTADTQQHVKKVTEIIASNTEGNTPDLSRVTSDKHPNKTSKIQDTPPTGLVRPNQSIQKAIKIASQSATSDILSEAKVTSQITPKYPIFSRKRGEEGSVKLAIKIDKNGTVISVDVLQSSGHTRLDKAALNAVSDAKFTPARLNNIVIASSKTLSIKFDLNDPFQ